MSALESLTPPAGSALDKDAIARRQQDMAKRSTEPSTSVGQLLSEAGLQKEAKGYEVPGGPFRLKPHQVRRGPYANRLPDYFKTESFLDLKRRIRETKGNTEAALVVETGEFTEVDGDKLPIYEVIFGHCRHQACAELSKEVIDGTTEDYPYLANIMRKEMPQALRVARTHSENAGREDTTPWEDARWYASLLENKVFASIRMIAISFGEDESWVGRLVRAANGLDKQILTILSDERNLPITTLEKIRKIKEADSEKYEERVAELLKENKQMKCSELLAALTVAEVKKASRKAQNLEGKDGAILGEFKLNREDKLAIVLNRRLKPEGLAKLADLVAKYSEPEK
ncbi:ParB/RepB/Spo0J family partition protein [Comamonas thiooxydans]|uniref:ParB/RepB/Spo0J family partition protein n=1 Tax=Comamonas thiooxydans TaxID=363952 RepID=UPI00118475BE|nr:hypothetical protein [Comamonas thiooxydans]